MSEILTVFLLKVALVNIIVQLEVQKIPQWCTETTGLPWERLLNLQNSAINLLTRS